MDTADIRGYALICVEIPWLSKYMDIKISGGKKGVSVRELIKQQIINRVVKISLNLSDFVCIGWGSSSDRIWMLWP